MIVTVTHTLMDGTVVRWYPDSTTLDQLPAAKPQLSASRNGVLIGGYLHQVPADVLALAQNVHTNLHHDHNAPVQHLATHRRRGWAGPYEPVTPPAQPADPSTEG
ncbi:hypothetical protein [Micromonospora aurantiaca (nom. illeg.)]|uniref:hypothetical protein n=1 Tax=Micromonospora aurantiaca (nom. illeg.) TaxID=47850 RepID=UPI0011A0D754